MQRKLMYQANRKLVKMNIIDNLNKRLTIDDGEVCYGGEEDILKEIEQCPVALPSDYIGFLKSISGNDQSAPNDLIFSMLSGEILIVTVSGWRNCFSIGSVILGQSSSKIADIFSAASISAISSGVSSAGRLFIITSPCSYLAFSDAVAHLAEMICTTFPFLNVHTIKRTFTIFPRTSYLSSHGCSSSTFRQSPSAGACFDAEKNCPLFAWCFVRIKTVQHEKDINSM